DPTVASILGVQHALPVTQTGDPGAADLLPQDISVGQAPLAARFFDDLSEPTRDRTEKPVPCVNDLVRRGLSTLRGRIASKRRSAGRRRTAGRRRIRLCQDRFGAPRDEGQNEEGGPHHNLHRVLHSLESCSIAVEFRRATGSGLDLVQKFPQVHFSHPPVGRRSELSSKLLSVVLMKDSVYHAKAIGLAIPESFLLRADE